MKKNEEKNRKIALNIMFYTKRVILNVLIFFLFMLIYYEYIQDKLFNEPILNMKWRFDWFMEFNEFLNIIYFIFMILIMGYILFYRQIKWLRKYSKK